MPVPKARRPDCKLVPLEKGSALCVLMHAVSPEVAKTRTATDNARDKVEDLRPFSDLGGHRLTETEDDVMSEAIFSRISLFFSLM